MSTSSRSVAILAGLFVVVVACNPIFDTGVTNTGAYNNLVVKIQVNRSFARVGESLQIRLTTINDANQPIVIESKDKFVLDIIVEDLGNRQILTSWSAQNPDKATHRIEWKPGETKTMEIDWVPRPEENDRVVGIVGILSEASKIRQAPSVLIHVTDPHPR